VIGQRTRVYEVMRGDRPLSLRMIRSLHEKLGVPAEVLIQPIHRKGKRRVRRTARKPIRTKRVGMRRSA
jgi:HTH-type transcriptional regulator/antitoxin HigA